MNRSVIPTLCQVSTNTNKNLFYCDRRILKEIGFHLLKKSLSYYLEEQEPKLYLYLLGMPVGKTQSQQGWYLVKHSHRLIQYPCNNFQQKYVRHWWFSCIVCCKKSSFYSLWWITESNWQAAVGSGMYVNRMLFLRVNVKWYLKAAWQCLCLRHLSGFC